ncbi:hypothetical protein AWZ03_013110, partial [Drosophila navojoa]
MMSRTSLVSSSEGGILAEGETSSEESSRDSSNDSPPCDLGLMERLLLTHPMWFLPGIQRSGAVHLLQGKEEGEERGMGLLQMEPEWGMFRRGGAEGACHQQQPQQEQQQQEQQEQEQQQQEQQLPSQPQPQLMSDKAADSCS